jgi:nucleotide-binding universal stress UspA family protein
MNPSQHLARLVVPLDTSATAEKALRWGALVARDRAMELHLVTVWSPDAPIPGIAPAKPEKDILADLQGYLEDVARGLRREGVSVTVEARAGDVVDEIRKAAEEPGSMVMIATHGQGGYQESRLGSVADRLIRTARAPVLVIPAIGES